jgi:FixJ family two-component response regulator
LAVLSELGNGPPGSSAEEFLCGRRPDVPACLVLDVRLPQLSGLDLQRELAKAGVQIPIIFITGHERTSSHLN